MRVEGALPPIPIDEKEESDIDDELEDPLKNDESPRRLACGHLFHSNCIRGWCLIGKRDICPYW